ncbi:hypothetical protein LTR85_006194 [Meristemomyces frigidus]|nr:hypothetical protein LTR85_006194 [Meristemomyces frigidus]
MALDTPSLRRSEVVSDVRLANAYRYLNIPRVEAGGISALTTIFSARALELAAEKELGKVRDPRCRQEDSIDLTGQTVEVVVGHSQHSFLVHEDVLTSTSEFFRSTLGKLWREGQQRKVVLPDDQSHWLYTKTIASISAEDSSQSALLAKLYVLGEELLDSNFQDCIIDAFICALREVRAKPAKTSTFRYCLRKQTVNLIYDGTPQKSPARQLMVDVYTREATGEAMKDENNNVQVHPEFLLDLASALLDKLHSAGGDVADHTGLDDGRPCSYHKHGKGEAGGGRAA